MTSFKEIVSKYGNITLTVINTYGFISQMIILFGVTATPLNAFLATLFGFSAVAGWATVAYDREMAKYAEARANVTNIKKQG